MHRAGGVVRGGALVNMLVIRPYEKPVKKYLDSLQRIELEDVLRSTRSATGICYCLLQTAGECRKCEWGSKQAQHLCQLLQHRFPPAVLDPLYPPRPLCVSIVMGKFGSEPWSEPELDQTGPYFRFRFGLWSRTGPTVPFKVQQVPSPC